jgi:hypothetical protein
MAAIAYPARSRPDRLAPARRPAVSPRVARRRRHVAAVVALLLVASAVWALGGLLGWLGSGPLAAPGPDPTVVPATTVVHVVQPGETVWSIARAAQPQGEIRPFVDRLERELGGRPLQVGDRLLLD